MSYFIKVTQTELPYLFKPQGLFTLKINITLALVALEDSHHLQGGMKFATQISPLLKILKLNAIIL
jgi:hypothetical protein